MKISQWQKAIAFITLLFLSVFGIKPAATTATPTQLENSPALLAQSCPYGDKKLSYTRVTTRDGDDLLVRSSPNGRIVGAIPSGWAVVPVKKDTTGRWVRITSQYGDINADPGFASAPYFRTGWVAAAYLKPIGQLCEKPVSFMRTQMQGLFGSKKVLVNEDWVQIGDRISRSLPK